MACPIKLCSENTQALTLQNVLDPESCVWFNLTRCWIKLDVVLSTGRQSVIQSDICHFIFSHDEIGNIISFGLDEIGNTINFGHHFFSGKQNVRSSKQWQHASHLFIIFFFKLITSGIAEKPSVFIFEILQSTYSWRPGQALKIIFFYQKKWVKIIWNVFSWNLF